jgi:hypothetical protein
MVCAVCGRYVPGRYALARTRAMASSAGTRVVAITAMVGYRNPGSRPNRISLAWWTALIRLTIAVWIDTGRPSSSRGRAKLVVQATGRYLEAMASDCVAEVMFALARSTATP